MSSNEVSLFHLIYLFGNKINELYRILLGEYDSLIIYYYQRFNKFLKNLELVMFSGPHHNSLHSSNLSL